MRRILVYGTLLVLIGFVVGFVSAMFLRDRVERRTLADRTGTDLARFSDISERVASGDTEGTMKIVRQEVSWRDEVLRGLWQQDPASIDSILPTVQSAQQTFRYQSDPALARALGWAPSWAVDNARRKFAHDILAPKKIAPELSIAAWLGDAHTLAELRGKVVLLDFWATSCGPCVAGMPALRKLQEEFAGRGLVVLAIHAAQERDKVEGFVQAKPFGLPVGIDDGRTFTDYGVHALPTKALVDRQGRVVWSPDVLDPSRKAMTKDEESSELRSQIEKALAE